MRDSADTQPVRAILHVDMDAFYASVEIMDDPSLAGKPVIVGGTPENRGVVAAASYEARKFGVHSAMSAYRAKKLCPHGIFIPPRGARYAELSRAIRAIFAEYTPLVEPISLDEAFLDVTGSRTLFGSAPHIGREIKRRIREEIGLVASVGVAPSKFLAKLASDFDKPDGFVVVTREEATAWLAGMPVGRLWGVGKVAQRKFESAGIHSVGDIAAMPVDRLEKFVGSWASRLKQLAVGIDDRPVVAHGEAKSISAETTFATDIGDADTLRDITDGLAERVARRLRRSGYVAATVGIKARYADFKTVTRAKTLPEPTTHSVTIRDTARELLEKRLDRRGRPLRLIGVALSNLERSELAPASLFDAASEKETKVDGLIDDLQDRFGAGVIHRGKGGRRK